MNTDTIYFRAVLTIALLWITVFAYLSYAEYRQSYRSAEYSRYSLPNDLTDECFSSVPDWSGDGVQFREPTIEETESCLKRARDTYEQSRASSNQFALEQAWKSFAFRGMLPPLIVMGIVAFWSIIAGGMSRVSSGYVGWLRFGSRRPIDQRKNDES